VWKHWSCTTVCCYALPCLNSVLCEITESSRIGSFFSAPF
jgi:hypothetical protein